MKYLPKKNQTTVIVVVAVVLLAIVLLLTLPSKRPVPKPAFQAQVSITDQGFIPATLMVKKGTKVNWVVSDTKPHQIASDPHPSHNSLPALLQNQPSQSSYSYTFDKVGTFTYHDETDPLKLRGSVIVK